MSPVPGTGVCLLLCCAVLCCVMCPVAARKLSYHKRNALAQGAGKTAGRQATQRSGATGRRRRRQQQMIRPGAGAVAEADDNDYVNNKNRSYEFHWANGEPRNSWGNRASSTYTTWTWRDYRLTGDDDGDSFALAADWTAQEEEEEATAEEQGQWVRRSYTMMTPTHICDVSTNTSHDEQIHEALLAVSLSACVCVSVCVSVRAACFHCLWLWHLDWPLTSTFGLVAGRELKVFAKSIFFCMFFLYLPPAGPLLASQYNQFVSFHLFTPN